MAGQDLQKIHRLFLRDDHLVRHWSDKVGLDLHQPENLRTLLFKSALLANDDGITLVSSTNIDHIYQNVAVAENSSLDRSARIFLDLARAGGPRKLRA